MNQPTPPPGNHQTGTHALGGICGPHKGDPLSRSIEQDANKLAHIITKDPTIFDDAKLAAPTPPTDWRKMCEELAQRLQPFANFACTDLAEDEPCSCYNCRAKEALTRAKAALEESK